MRARSSRLNSLGILISALFGAVYILQKWTTNGFDSTASHVIRTPRHVINTGGHNHIDPSVLTRGSAVLVFWENFDSWYPATVADIDIVNHQVTLAYDDGFEETIGYRGVTMSLLDKKDAIPSVTKSLTTKLHSTSDRAYVIPTIDLGQMSQTSRLGRKRSASAISTIPDLLRIKSKVTSTYQSQQRSAAQSTTLAQSSSLESRTNVLERSTRKLMTDTTVGSQKSFDADVASDFYEQFYEDAESANNHVYSNSRRTHEQSQQKFAKLHKKLQDDRYAEVYGQDWDEKDIKAVPS